VITVVALFQMPPSTTLADAKAIFESTAPKYREVDGLVRKYYIFDPMTHKAGGCYLLKDRAAALHLFDDRWRTFVQSKYAAAPEVTMFETPVVVDNLTAQILVDA
jgi:hypothetical protein